jgi:siroheme synthase (precorrin-2 oxidase/ferrochelatase)
MDMEVHDAAMARGLIRYCPICDGYEVTDKKIAVIGTGEQRVAETRFLRSYTSDLTLVSPDLAARSRRARARRAGGDGVTLDRRAGDRDRARRRHDRAGHRKRTP